MRPRPSSLAHLVLAAAMTTVVLLTLDVVTPHDGILVVTPEPNGQVAPPSHDPTLTSDIDRAE